MNDFETEYENHGITFQSLPEISMSKDRVNIGTKEQDTFRKEVLDAYKNSTAKDKAPYCIAIAYTGHLAVKDAEKKITSRITGGSSTLWEVDIEYKNGKEKGKKKHHLWNNIDSDDWFVKCYFVPDGTLNAIKDTFGLGRLPISKDKITLNNPTEGSTRVRIDISSLPAEKGKVTLIVNCINRMRGGVSFRDTNIVAICTRAWWNTILTDEQNETIVHEVGHQIGMVSDGQEALDKGGFHYDSSKGHVGDHCHSGIPTGRTRYDTYNRGESPNCVMYGEGAGLSFCADCAEKVRKTDLSEGVKKSNIYAKKK